MATTLLCRLAVMMVAFMITSAYGLVQSVDGGAGAFAPLLHITSPEHPFHDPKKTYEDTIIESIMSQRSAAGSTSKILQTDPDAGLSSLSGYLMSYYIGSNKVNVYGIIDTGSDLIWLQCKPCHQCYDQGSIPLYDPTQSETYSVSRCGSNACTSIGSSVSCGFGRDPDCNYNIKYGIGNNDLSSSGVIGVDVMGLLSGSNGNNDIVTFPRGFAFGCGYSQTSLPTKSRKFPGIVGLGNSDASLVRQLGFTRFSYCLKGGPKNFDGIIQFGSAVHIPKNPRTTPITRDTRTPFYYLTVNGLMVGEKFLDVGQFFKPVPNILNSGFVIDSGTVLTHLHTEAFDALRSEMEIAFGRKNVKPTQIPPFEICVETQQLNDPPPITFVMQDSNYSLLDVNAWLTYKPEGYYEHRCLAILRSASEQSLLGAHNIRNHNIGYDLAKNQLSLEPNPNCIMNWTSSLRNSYVLMYFSLLIIYLSI